MGRYLADLEFISSTLSLAEIAVLVGHPPDPTSHDLGDRTPRGRVRGHSIWRLSSTAGDAASLEEHLSQLRDHAEELGLLVRDDLPDGLQRVLSIAVMHDTYTCTVRLPSPLLVPFLVAGFDLEISAYPVDEESGE